MWFSGTIKTSFRPNADAQAVSNDSLVGNFPLSKRGYVVRYTLSGLLLNRYVMLDRLYCFYAILLDQFCLFIYFYEQCYYISKNQ